MTRAALLPAGSDPFMLAYWLRNYETWAQYVDELHVTVSGRLELDALDYVRECVAAVPNATMYHVGHRTDHGEMLRFLLSTTDAQHVMLCEDDAYVRRPEVIDECFRFAESGGIVGTPRGSFASVEVTSAASAALGGDYSYWPCFVFVERDKLMSTDRQFGGVRWKVGDMMLGHRMAEASVSDTFVWASYQLRAMGLGERLLDNHRLSGQAIPGDAPWFHVGSLSGGHGWAFMGNLERERYEAEVDVFRRVPDAVQRVAWWRRIWSSSDGIPDYHERYGRALEAFAGDIGVSSDAVKDYQRFIDSLVTWAER